MTIVLNHAVVPVGDKHSSARLLADLLGLVVGSPAGPFVPVRVNEELTLDFDDRFGAHPGHPLDVVASCVGGVRFRGSA